MPLIATAGAPAANSYCTLSEASAFLQERLYTEPWDEAVDPTRAGALIWATRLLDEQVNWYGTPRAITQSLAWPMTGQVDQYARIVTQTDVPLIIKRATAYYALALLRDVSEAPGAADLEGLSQFHMGDTTLTFRAQRPVSAAQRIPTEIRQMLRFYGHIAGGFNMPLLRT